MQDQGGITPTQLAEAFTPSGQKHADPDFPAVPGLQLVEAGEVPTPQDETTPPIRVSVDSIMDQIHQHWARLMAAQIQHNAELSAAVAALSDEVAELKAKHVAMMGANGL